MSRIDALIAKLCPDGVEFRELGECTAYSRTRIDASELDETNFVGVDNLLQNAAGKTDASYPPNTARLTAYEVGDILIGNIRPYLKKIWLADNSGGCSGDVLAVRIVEACRPELTPEFLYRLLASDIFFAYNTQHAKGAKMPRGSKEAILKYRVPVPPLEIQQEIVVILDKFTKLEAELEAELEARRRQYQHYRDALLTFGERTDSASKQASIRWSKLGEVYHFSSGLSKSADQFGAGSPFLSYKTVFKNKSVPATLSELVNTSKAEQERYSIRKGDVFVTRTSESLEELGMSCAALEDFPTATFNGFTKRLRPKEPSQIDPKFSAFFFRSTHFRNQIARMAVLSTRVSLNDSILANIKMPIPPLEEQARIVSILDKFDALVNDLSSGLPAEIKARRQQYEHYRDRLLTFQEAA